MKPICARFRDGCLVRHGPHTGRFFGGSSSNSYGRGWCFQGEGVMKRGGKRSRLVGAGVALSRGGLYETRREAESSRRGGRGWEEGRGRLRRPRPGPTSAFSLHAGRRKRPLPPRPF